MASPDRDRRRKWMIIFPRRGNRRKTAPLAVGLALGLLLGLPPGSGELWAFSISESRIFVEGPFLVRLQIQLSGPGSLKKKPLRVSALKVKIKNERASTAPLSIRSIRAYPNPSVHQDIETQGFSVSPGQWVTKYYRLKKGHHPLLPDEGFIGIDFEKFSVTFHPRQQKFQGPNKKREGEAGDREKGPGKDGEKPASPADRSSIAR
ncbi:MAG: hypothetical protein HY697_03870 [Deltaproteobacteria bacterium]|nr:hypothetical protein [Deltaproteobacteria bacterium]